MIYSKTPVYDNFDGPWLYIKGPCYTSIAIVQGLQVKIEKVQLNI